MDIAQARAVCLPLIGGNNVVDILFDILRAGKTRDIMVGFEAHSPDQLFDGKNLIIEGGAVSARVKIPGVDLIADQVDGRATMKDGILHIEPGKGQIQGARIVGGTLDIDIVNHEGVPFSGKFDLEADLARLPQTLSRLLPDTALALELNRVSDVQGAARGVLELNLPPGHDLLDIKVTADRIHASGRYAPIPWPLSLDIEQFRYSKDKVILDNIKGTAGINPIQLKQGEFNLSPPFEFTIRDAQAQVSTDTLISWARNHPKVMTTLSPLTTASGPMTVSGIQIQGPMFSPQKWEYRLQGTARDMSVGFTEGQFAVRDLSGSLTFSHQGIGLRDLNGWIRDLSWLDTTPWEWNSSITLPLEMTRGNLTNNREGCTFEADLKAPAGPRVGLTLAGASPDSLAPTQVTIKDQQSDVQITRTPTDRPRMDVKGHLNTLTLDNLLVNGSSLHNTLQAVTLGRPLTLSAEPNGTIHVQAGHLNLDRVMAEIPRFKPQISSRSAGERATRPPLLPTQWTLNSDVLVFHGKMFTGVESRVRFDGEKTKINLKKAGLCGLQAEGHVDLIQDKGAVTASSRLTIGSEKDDDASQLFDCLLGSKSIIEGRYTLEGELSGQGPAGLIARHQNGRLKFLAENGRIYKATLLSRILSVLNILGDMDIRQQGFGYKTLTVVTEIRQSVIHIKKAYIDADDMAIVASGWVDPFNDRMDLTFLVAPLKTIDTIIQHIPLVNTLLSGRLVSFPVKASGSLSDPSVTPLHPSAVGRGLITLIGDLIQAPTRLFKGENQNE